MTMVIIVKMDIDNNQRSNYDASFYTHNGKNNNQDDSNNNRSKMMLMIWPKTV